MRRYVATIFISLGALTACSTSTSPSPIAAVQPALPAALVALDDGFQVLRSQADPELYAASCTGKPSVKLNAPWRLAIPASGVTSQEDTLAFTPSTEPLALELVDPAARDSKPRRVRLRCLPQGFPRIEIDGSFSSWLMLTSMPTEPDVNPFQMILEPNGFPAWFRQTPGSLADFFRVGDEIVTFTPGARPIASFSNAPGAGFRRGGLDGSITTQWAPSQGPGLDFHAMALLGNGNALALRYEVANTPLDPTEGKIPAQIQENVSQCPVSAPTAQSETLRGRIVEVTPAGQVKRSWSIEDHLPQASSSADWVNIADANSAPRCVVDAEHLNGLLFYPQQGAAPDQGQVILTGRHIDGAALLDWPSGDVLWTLGGRQGAKSLTILDDPLGGPVHPHDANFIDKDRVLLYDNRSGGEVSRALIYRIDLKKRTATLESSYTTWCPAGTETPGEVCSAFAMGSARPTADGASILVGWGTATTTAAEFTRVAGASSAPSASLRLVNSWAYRVLPTAAFDIEMLLTAQQALPALP